MIEARAQRRLIEFGSVNCSNEIVGGLHHIQLRSIPKEYRCPSVARLILNVIYSVSIPKTVFIRSVSASSVTLIILGRTVKICGMEDRNIRRPFDLFDPTHSIEYVGLNDRIGGGSSR